MLKPLRCLMKKLHKYLLLSYLGPFVMTFFIALFIILMQFLWKYIDDLVGKGLDWHIILKLLYYASATFVPLALPLAILLSSLMTFGNLGEHFELVSLKSSGISLQKFMKPLIILSVIISLLAFYFSNNILPIANLKMGALLFDVREQKPALNIKEGVFYKGIENYVIKVGKKEKDGITIHNVHIYDHSQRLGNINVTYAKSGRMEMTPDEKYLVFTLFDGFNYSEKVDGKHITGVRPFQRISFDEQIRKFDLSSFAMTRTNEEFFKDNYQMLNLKQLELAIDSLEANLNNKFEEHTESLMRRFYFLNVYTQRDSIKNIFGEDASENQSFLKLKETHDTVEEMSLKNLLRKQMPDNMADNLNADSDSLDVAEIDTLIIRSNILEVFGKNEQQRILDGAIQSARNNKDYVYFANEDRIGRQRVINRHNIEWHRKFTLSFACFILFFIGAPLGAIIRKGGFGLPVVISVMFFIIYHVLSMTGEKFVRQGALPAYEGMWIATLVLFPIGIFLTVKATTDSPILDTDTYVKLLKRIKRLFVKTT